MCENSSLNICTYKGWEVGGYGGLPVDGAERVIKRIAEEGVVCTAEWLLYEIGQGPYIIPDFKKLNKDSQRINTAEISEEKEKILQEILLFRKNFPEAIDYQIKDDGVTPIYNPNDFVAGVKYFGDTIRTIVNQYCIVQTLDGKTLVRLLKEGTSPNKFLLLCTNPQTLVTNPALYDVELASAAPILRCYKQIKPEK
ncbi:MAG: hypothetical protein WCW01_04360 [Gammaproteobacteria bacterium]